MNPQTSEDVAAIVWPREQCYSATLLCELGCHVDDIPHHFIFPIENLSIRNIVYLLIILDGGVKSFLFSPLFEETIQFDDHIFLNGLKTTN